MDTSFSTTRSKSSSSMTFYNGYELKFERGETLSDLQHHYWRIGSSKLVYFFRGKKSRVTVVSVDSPKISQTLESIDDGCPIAIDIDWIPDFKHGNDNPICIFKFCTTKGCVVVLNEGLGPNNDMFDFLNNHYFFGKGMGIAHKKLVKMFGTSFTIRDFEREFLIPYNIPQDFDGMIESLAGIPKQPFKDKTLVWESSFDSFPLTVLQVLYAAFDVCALYECYYAAKTLYNFKFNFTGSSDRLDSLSLSNMSSTYSPDEESLFASYRRPDKPINGENTICSGDFFTESPLVHAGGLSADFERFQPGVGGGKYRPGSDYRSESAMSSRGPKIEPSKVRSVSAMSSTYAGSVRSARSSSSAGRYYTRDEVERILSENIPGFSHGLMSLLKESDLVKFNRMFRRDPSPLRYSQIF